MKISNIEQLNEVRNVALNEIKNSKCRVLICAGTGCLAGGSGKIYNRILELVNNNPNIEVSFDGHVPHDNIGVKKSGCHGFCEMGPLMRIEPMGILYTKVKLDDCEGFVRVKSVYVTTSSKSTDEEKDMIEAKLKEGVII